jgi:hypothetical protein
MGNPNSDSKVRENRLRRMADRQQLRLRKSKLRDPRAIGYGTYMLVDLSTGFLVLGDTNLGYGFDLDDVEKYLMSGSCRDL